MVAAAVITVLYNYELLAHGSSSHYIYTWCVVIIGLLQSFRLSFAYRYEATRVI